MQLTSAHLAAVALAIGASLSNVAIADVDVVGQVTPADNPFSLFLEEGIPSAGNTVQLSFTNGFGNLTDESGRMGQPFYERDLPVVVGDNTFGSISINNQSSLRFTHLVLGGTEADATTYADADALVGSTNGFGVMSIDGFGSNYTNHPLIVPSRFANPANSEQTRFNIPTNWDFGVDGTLSDIQRDDAGAYDAYVGLTGSGQLSITNGGRAEIQDSFIVAYGPQSTGLVEVVGQGSLLANYGNLSPSGVASMASSGAGPSQMIIGAYGEGTLRVLEGGTVNALVGAAIGATQSDGRPFDGTPLSDDFERGGRGTVLVDGAGSKWNITTAETASGLDPGATRSGLAIGEFQTGFVAAAESLPNYAEDVGQGTLIVSNNGQVRVIAESETSDDGDIRIGRFGRIQLDGGSVEASDEIYSDGVIEGDGDILVSRFVNRELGEVRVGSNQKLTIRSDGTGPLGIAMVGAGIAPTGLPAGTTNFFSVNLGRIEVVGDTLGNKAELSLNRSVQAMTMPTVADENRFWNVQRTLGGETTRGVITARDATLRFNHDLRNDGQIAFIGGDNLVTGDIENTVNGVIAISNQSDVTFEDNIVNDGTITLISDSDATILGNYSGAGALIDFNPATINVAGNFTLGGDIALNSDLPTVGGQLGLVVGGGDTGSAFTRLAITGDAIFDIAGASIDITSLSPVGGPVTLGDTFELITVLGTSDLDAAIMSGNLNITSLPELLNPTFGFVPVMGSSNLILEVVNATIIGADFDNSGFVDTADLAIWRMFFGLQSGATGITGDADGDGDVDADDFYLLLDQIGGAPMPIPSLLAGTVAGTAVPEPSTLSLLALLSLVGLIRRRR